MHQARGVANSAGAKVPVARLDARRNTQKGKRPDGCPQNEVIYANKEVGKLNHHQHAYLRHSDGFYCTKLKVTRLFEQIQVSGI